MPRKRNPVPTYRLHKQSGQAIVTVRTAAGRRRDVLLGPYDSPESHAEYQRVLAEQQASPAAQVAAVGHTSLTVNEVLLAFMQWAKVYYRDGDGRETGEAAVIGRAIAPVRELYGHTLAAEFGPRALAAVRGRMVAADLCRTLVNKQVDRVKRVFKWAAAEELVPVTVYQSLRTLAGLKRGRTEARESEPVRPVDPAHVAATLPHLNRHVRAMVELELLTGMRPGEVCRLTLGEVERAGGVWTYRPGRHKTLYRGKDRAVPIGPRARALVTAFLVNDRPPPTGWEKVDLAADRTGRFAMADAYQEAGRPRDADLLRDTGRAVVLVAGCVVDPAAVLFNPREAREERYAAMRAARKSKVPPSQRNRKSTNPKKRPRESFEASVYANAVAFGVDQAGVPHWHPNQLRHTFASEVRRRFGLEAAQVLLGHARADVTQVYAERDAALAARVAAEIG